jgi:hypothetical protein
MTPYGRFLYSMAIGSSVQILTVGAWNPYYEIHVESMRISKSFTIEPEISSYVDETKGERSASDRVNDLLRRAMIQEQYERLEAEAAEFFSGANSDRTEAREFQKASLRTFGRD